MVRLGEGAKNFSAWTVRVVTFECKVMEGGVCSNFSALFQAKNSPYVLMQQVELADLYDKSCITSIRATNQFNHSNKKNIYILILFHEFMEVV